MNPQELPQYNPRAKVSNTLSVTEPGERTICEIKRHPVGILTVYIMIGFMLIVVAILAFVIAPHLASNNSTQVTQIGALVFLLFTTICGVYGLIATKVYWGNSWVLTSDSVTQINQMSLFKHQSSQLSLGNLEDVSAGQSGILQDMFKYGQLKVETAGERSKFVFSFCPNPNYYAQQILAAREAFEQSRGAESNQGLYPPAAAQANYPPAVGTAPTPSMQPPAGQPPVNPVPVQQQYPPGNPQPPYDPGVNIGT